MELSEKLIGFIEEFDINSVDELLEQYANLEEDEDLGDDIFIAVFEGEAISNFFAAKKENKDKMRKINDMFLDEVLAQHEQEKWNTNSTRHKSRNGETHTEIPIFEKDDIITSSSRGERETLQGLKESQN